MKIIILLAFFVNLVFANIAVVSAFKGDADIIRGEKTISVKTGIKLEKNDKLNTRKNTKVQLIFKDKTIITIGKNSNFSIFDYLYDEKSAATKSTKARFGFAKGIFRTVTGKIGKINPSKFKIKVKSASIGIRGTKFDVAVSPTHTKIGVGQGGISFTEGVQVVDVNPGEVMVYNIKTGGVAVTEGVLEETSDFAEEEEKKEDKKDKKEDKKDKKSSESKKEDKKADGEPDLGEEPPMETPEDIGTPPIVDLDIISELIADIETKDKEIKEETKNQTNDSNNKTLTEAVSNSSIDPTTSTPVGSSPDSILTELDSGTYERLVSNSFSKENTAGATEEYLSYGYWRVKNTTTAVSIDATGILTPDAYVNSLIGELGQTANYNGGITSVITNAGVSTLVENGSISLDVDFEKSTFAGSISVNSDWQASIASGGTVNGNGFSSSAISSTSTTSGVQGISGQINGKFYGAEAYGAAGGITLDSTSDGSVKAVFGATRLNTPN